jgi:diguanylate cyclase
VPAPDAGVDDPSQPSQAWAALLERLVRGLEGGSRQWTIGRRKDSVQRVLAANRSDMQRLRQRLEPLVSAWEADHASAPGRAVEPLQAKSAAPGAADPAQVQGRQTGRRW